MDASEQSQALGPGAWTPLGRPPAELLGPRMRSRGGLSPSRRAGNPQQLAPPLRGPGLLSHSLLSAATEYLCPPTPRTPLAKRTERLSRTEHPVGSGVRALVRRKKVGSTLSVTDFTISFISTHTHASEGGGFSLVSGCPPWWLEILGP